MTDALVDIASSQREFALKSHFDIAAAEVAEKLDIIGTPEAMNLLNRLFQQTRVNYINLPALIIEVNRTLKKYGAQTVKSIQAEQEAYEAEMNGEVDESEGGSEKADHEIDDGEAYSEE